MLLAQALVTALLSGLFSGAIVFALNERRDRSNLLLTKAENAVEAYTKWLDAISRWPLAHYDLFISDDRRQAEKAISEIQKRAEGHRARAKMLIGVYLPKERSLITKLDQAYAKFLEFGMTMRIAAVEGERIPNGAKEEITSAGKLIVDVGLDGLEELLNAARERAYAPYLIRSPRVVLPKKLKP